MAAVPDDYNLIRHLGDGSFADVYLVRHKELDYIRALKISKDNIDDQSDKKWIKFFKECQLLLKIGNGGHPNIVKIYNPRLVNNRAVVEMDYIDGESLHSYIERRNGFLPYSEVCRFIKDIIGAMAYCHVDIFQFLLNPKEDNLSLDQIDPSNGIKYILPPEKEAELVKKYGVCHNDLHANNIMRRSLDGSYVLLDFGLAIQNKVAVNSTEKHQGNVQYSAPEKFDHLEPTIRSDVYSLGILLYNVLTGKVPFPLRGTIPMYESEVWEAHKNKKPPEIFPLRKAAFESSYPGVLYIEDYPRDLERVILKCLAKKPEDRYANAKELYAAVMNVITAYDELASLDTANHKLTAQLSTANQEISRLQEESSWKDSILSHSEVELARVRNEAHKIKATLDKKTSQLATSKRNNNRWKLLAFITTLIFGIGLIWAITSKLDVSATGSVFPQDSITVINNTGDIPIQSQQIASSVPIITTVHDTIVVRDTVKITNTVKSEPKIVEKTKVEYRNSPETQKELNRLRTENKSLKGQVQRYKECLP